MKPVVRRSVEDATGQRCVDILQTETAFAWVECRRDPEDAHGWRRMGEVKGGYGSEAEALVAAARSVGWMTTDVDDWS